MSPSRQRIWQLKQQKQHRCCTCGRAAKGLFCEEHVVARRVYGRKRVRCKPRKIGGVPYDDKERYEKKRREAAAAYGLKKHSSASVARKYGVSRATVIKLARQYGYPIGKQGEKR